MLSKLSFKMLRSKTTFLVKGTQCSSDAERGLYPVGEQRAAINRAFNDYFSSLGAALSLEQ